MSTGDFTIEANIVDLHQRRTGFGTVIIKAGRIADVQFQGDARPDTPYLMPGFIDAHIHIESSMVTPPAFARVAITHGTIATVSDPHEIANVCGIEGVRYMTDLGKISGFKFFFGAPSCVPATPFETAGATIDADGVLDLLQDENIHYLSEMMNYPAVLRHDPLVMDKIKAALALGLPVDGHAPGLKGEEAMRYASAGISTDHECTTLEEALDKINAGMKIIIREGSAAKNYNALHPLIGLHADRVMFCSDDKHPDDLMRGHINELVIRSLELGYDIFDVLRIACINPVQHYGLNIGTLRNGDPADMIMVEDLKALRTLNVWINGTLSFDKGEVLLPDVPTHFINSFAAKPITIDSLQLELIAGEAKVIEAIDGSLLTNGTTACMKAGKFEGDVVSDILKIAVVNRYANPAPALGLIKGFGLKKGALASSVAHDSHNIVAVGTSDIDLMNCINAVINTRGGIAACTDGQMHTLPLPIAGLMSPDPVYRVANQYELLTDFTRSTLGSGLHAPFMTLSFMALLVIPALKMSDLGLFNGQTFEFIPLQN